MMEHNTAERGAWWPSACWSERGAGHQLEKGSGRHGVPSTLCLGRAGKMMMQIFHSLNMVFPF